MNKNKKGFTLVELLAVIVILALLMAIAVASFGPIIRSSQEQAMTKTGSNTLDIVHSVLIVNNELNGGLYTFDKTILKAGTGDSAPLGGKYVYHDTTANASTNLGTDYKKVGGTAGVYSFSAKVNNADVNTVDAARTLCAQEKESFVYVDQSATDINDINLYLCLATTETKLFGYSSNYLNNDFSTLSNFSNNNDNNG